MPRVALGKVGGVKPTSAVTKTMRDAADRLYDAFLRDPTPTKRFGLFDRAYTRFVKETAKEFDKMATKIFRMWQLPEAIEPQDCLQDLHVEIVRILHKYKPEKATVAAYLIWNAFARAKKECNRHRGKVRDRDPSIHALVVSGLLSMGESGPERFDDCIDRLGLESDSIELDRDCESMLDSKKMLRQVRRHLSKQDAQYIRRIVSNGGNVRQTAFSMISAVDEMHEVQCERLVQIKTRKLMAAMKNAAAVWQQIQEQDDEKERQKERQKERSEERRQTKAAIAASLRDRRPQAGVRRTGETQIINKRDRKRADGSSLFLLCA